MTKNNLPRKLQNLRVAIAHDFLNQLGGGEQVLYDLCHIFPDAPIFTLTYDAQATCGVFANRQIITSSLQKFPRFIRVRGRKFLLPLCARAAENLNFKGYDLIISSANPWMKGIIVPQDTIHVSYLHAATRFLWDWKDEYLEEQKLNPITRFFVNRMTFSARKWDQLAADRPDYLLCNSETTSRRILKYYHRTAEVIYPGVHALDTFRPHPRHQDYFFIISRLSPYKKIDIAIQAFNEINLPLKIAGTGSDLRRLKKMARKNISFLGRVSDDEKRRLFENCLGFINLTDEDFGITTIEAHAAGKPVIARYAGGSRELIKENKNGLFFTDLTPDSIIDALHRFSKQKWSPDLIRHTAEKYSVENFRRNLLDFLEKII